MNKLLAKLFIKNYENTTDSKVRNAYGTLSSVIGMICNALLSAMKIAVGAMTASISILADGINNLSDMASSGVSLAGFKIAGRPPDKKHPFGYARMEYIAALIISFIIIVIGGQLIFSSIDSIINKSAPTTGYSMIIVLAISIAVKLWMAVFYKIYAKQIDSSTLKAVSVDSLNDVLATAVVLICTLITMFADVNLDGYAGIAVSIYILIAGFKLMIETLSPLIGEKPSAKVVSDIINKAKSFEGILGIHDLVVHNYGPSKYFITFHAEVDYRTDLMASHELIDRIEKELTTQDIHVVIHLDPLVTDDEQINSMKDTVSKILKDINADIKMHDFRTIIGPSRTNLIFDVVMPDGLKYTKEELTKAVNKKLHAINNSWFAVIEIDYNYIDLK